MSNPTVDGNTQLGQIYVNLVDVLFAIVLSQGFVFLSSSNGLLSWLGKADFVSIINTVSVYLIVVGSWIRYHAVLQKFPKERTWRFGIDIALMLLYYFGFVQVGNPFVVSIVFLAIFALYSAWSAFRVKEYPNSGDERWTLGFSTNFLFTAIATITIAAGFTTSFLDTGGITISFLMMFIVLGYTLLTVRHKDSNTESVRVSSSTKH